MIVGIVLIFGCGYLAIFLHLSAICWLLMLIGVPLGMLGNVSLQRSRQAVVHIDAAKHYQHLSSAAFTARIH